MTYKFYITEALKVVVEDIAQITGGVTLKSSFADVLSGNIPPEDNRTSDEIIGHMKTGLSKLGAE